MDVVLVHSGVTDSGEWDGVRPELEAAGHRVLAPDLPGYGRRPEEPREFSLGRFVLGLDFERAALVGTSLGSRGVLEAVLMAPERVDACVLVSPNPFGWGEGVQRLSEQEEALFEERRLDEAADVMVRAWVVGPHREDDAVPAALRARVHAMQKRAYELQEGVEGRLVRLEIEPAKVRAPTLVIRGALDQDDLGAAERLAHEIPDARLVVYDDCAHLPTMEQPDRVARDVLEFLASVS
jgi:pimeloyl-ACP methyl ester carboxylesterase